MPGPWYFAWVDATETTFSAATHAREDISVYGFNLSQTEGEFASLRIDVKNPKVGLLAPGRKQWAWFSYDDGSGVEPLFFGRLVAIPDSLQAEVVSLEFIARPEDFDDQKRALAETLKVAPFYDPIWIDPLYRDDPDTVLEARPALWNVHPVTHAVTISDIIEGEAGTINLASAGYYDSLSVTYQQTPVSLIRCTASVSWDQAAVGTVDLTQTVCDAFAAAGTTHAGLVTSYTGEGLSRDWPKPEARIGAGWEVGESSVERVDGIAVPTMVYGVELATATAGFPLWALRPVFKCNYGVQRQRSEVVSFEIAADVQALVSAPREDATIDILMSSSEADKPVDAGGALPIGDVRRSSYFLTGRGRQSLEHLIVRCRSRLLMRARAVDVSIEVPFSLGVLVTCRHSATIADPRLPGGTATGKVIAYSHSLDGDSGQLRSGVTIGCTIGKGNTVTPVSGAPDYVDAGYADDDYQTTTGGATDVAGAGILLNDYGNTVIDDDGVDLFRMTPDRVVQNITVLNGETAQRAILDDKFVDVGEAITALNDAYTEVALTLLPLTGGPFETAFAITTSDLMVPRTIDLEAA